MAAGPAILALTAVGTVVGAVGNLQAGAAEAAAASHRAAQLERDAEMIDLNRQAELRRTEIAASDERRASRRRLAAIRAAYGSSGVEMSGTPLDVLSEAAMEDALTVRRIEAEGRETSRRATLDMQGRRETADVQRAAGRNSRTASYFNAGASLLRGGGQALRRSA